MPTGDAVDHPKHYNDLPAQCHACGETVECIDVVEEMVFNLGNAVKYLWRVGAKDDAITDLKKAAWYINREIDRRLKAAKADG